MKELLYIFILLIAFLGAALWMAGFGRLKSGAQVLTVEEPPSAPTPSTQPTSLKVLSWNMGYGYGEGSAGNGYENKPRAHFEHAIEEIAHTIRESQADIVGLQEIDFGSDRSGGFDQLEKLKTLLPELPYATRIQGWDANYVPFPYWPPSLHFGKVKSGGAILSRYPLSNPKGILLPKPSSQLWAYNLFYLYRFFHKVTVHLSKDQTLEVANLHLEAFDQDNRIKQARALVEEGHLDTVDLLMGDFNTVPEDAAQKSHFEDEPRDTYENDSTLSLIASRLTPASLEGNMFHDRKDDWTFPSSHPNRRLDYFFYAQEKFKITHFTVLHHALTSDHLPIRIEFLHR